MKIIWNFRQSPTRRHFDYNFDFEILTVEIVVSRMHRCMRTVNSVVRVIIIY